MSRREKPKKPLSKKVSTLLEQLQRKRNVRALAKRFLIVCEDCKSAPNYFEALKNYFNLSATSMEVVGSDGHSQPIQVVARAAERMKRAAQRDAGTEPFERVWCAIDGDYGNKIANARAKAEKNKIELAISTKCFEYWLLLHFEESDSSTNDCKALIHALKQKGYIPDYRKGKCDFDAIVPSVREASRRAKKLRKPGIERGDLPEEQNPCSEVYKLIDAILDVMP